MNKNALIVLLKAPEKGKIKTRLSRDLGEPFVLELYKGFILDILGNLDPVNEIFVYVWPPEKQAELEVFIGKGYLLAPQRGNDLGEKMANAFSDVFKKGYDRAVLIGSDIPEISSDIIFQAFDMLDNRHCVIGPSKDGGYYLIGFQKSRFSNHLFKGMKWSTSEVFNQTLGSMENHSLSWGTLPILEDIDTLNDLKSLMKRVKNGQKIGPRTRELLKKR